MVSTPAALPPVPNGVYRLHVRLDADPEKLSKEEESDEVQGERLTDVPLARILSSNRKLHSTV